MCGRADYLKELRDQLFADAHDSLGEPSHFPIMTNARRIRDLHAQHIAGNEPNGCVMCSHDRGAGSGVHFDMCTRCATDHYA